MIKQFSLDEDINLLYLLKQIREASQYSYNIYTNLSHSHEYSLADPLYLKFNTIPALLAGPDVPHNLPWDNIKSSVQDSLLFASDKALFYLGQQGINPHFGLGFDFNPVQELRILASSCYESPFIFHIAFNANAVKQIHAQKLFLYSSQDTIVKWFLDEWKVTASHPVDFLEIEFLFQSIAKQLGCNPIKNLSDTDALPLEHSKSQIEDIVNKIHAEIQLGSPSLTHRQISDTFNKWLSSLESALKVVFESLDYLKPLRDNYLINQIPLPMEITERCAAFDQKLELETVYLPFLSQGFKVFDLLYKDKKYAKNSNELIQDETERLLFMQYKINLYDYLKILLGHHIQNARTAMQAEVLPKITKEETSKPLYPQYNYTFSPTSFIIEDTDLNIHYEETLHEENHPFPEVAKTYHDNGSLKSEIYHQNGMKHGPSLFYGLKGNLLARGWFIHNQRTGINEQFYINGQLFSRQRFFQGILEGKQEYFYTDGNLKSLLEYKEGKLDGTVQLFYPSGSLKRSINFINGKRHGLEEMWYPDGKKEVEANYEHNKPVGTTKTWHSNGHIAKQITFQTAVNDFQMTLWTEQGQVVQTTTSQPTSAMASLMTQTMELEKLIDEASGKLIELFNKKNE